MTKPRKRVSGSEGRLAVVYLDPKRLRAASRNARTHSKSQVEQLVTAIKTFGFTQPILIDERMSIIAGHGRREAAIAAGMATVPTITLRGLTQTKRRALMLADNRIPLNAGWDEELLAIELGELQNEEGVELGALGFTESDVERILGSGPDAGESPTVEFKEAYSVIVELENEKQQTRLLERLSKEGFKCKALIA